MESLAAKLHIKPHNSVLVLNADKDFLKHFTRLPKGATISQKTNGLFDVVILCARTKAELEALAPRGETSLTDGGIYWVAIPKKSSGKQTDLTMNSGWEIMDKLFLTIVSSISFDSTWSGFRFKQKGTVLESQAKKDRTASDQFIDSKKGIVTLPPDLKAVLGKQRGALKFFESLSFSNRKEYVVWIVSAKQDATRKRRIKMMVEKLESELKNPAAKE